MIIPSMKEASDKAFITKVIATFILVILFSVTTGMYANGDPKDKIDENKTKQYEYLKKAKYFKIRAELEAGEITLEEAQKMWQKALKKLKKREGN